MPSYSRQIQIPGKSAAELYEKIAADIERVMTKASVGKLDVSKDPAKKQVSVKSSMFSAVLSCEDGKVSLNGSLSLLATPFRSKIDEGIDRWVQKTFGQA